VWFLSTVSRSAAIERVRRRRMAVGRCSHPQRNSDRRSADRQAGCRCDRPECPQMSFSTSSPASVIVCRQPISSHRLRCKGMAQPVWGDVSNHGFVLKHRQSAPVETVLPSPPGSRKHRPARCLFQCGPLTPELRPTADRTHAGAGFGVVKAQALPLQVAFGAVQIDNFTGSARKRDQPYDGQRLPALCTGLRSI
jgi:hypothetical protein